MLAQVLFKEVFLAYLNAALLEPVLAIAGMQVGAPLRPLALVAPTYRMVRSSAPAPDE